MSNNSNAFMASAKKSKRQQASIQHAQPEVDELVCINVRIPKSMQRSSNITRWRRVRT